MNISAKIIETEAGATIPKILYIMGTGRSGTTILEILLGDNPGIFGGGELKGLFRDCIQKNEICSCGKPGLECPFWANVFENGKWKKSDIQSITHLFKTIEWHSNFPLLYLNLISRKKMSLYKKINQKLFQSIQIISGQRVIVDSSKYAGRVLALSKTFPGKVKILCMTRSPHGLLKAFQKKNAVEQKPKSLLTTFLYYSYVLMCCRLVSLRIDEEIYNIKYDDFVSNPLKILGEIEKWSGLNLSNARSKISQGDYHEIGHVLSGNRLRKKGKIRFQPNLALKPIRGFREHITLIAMNFVRLLLKY